MRIAVCDDSSLDRELIVSLLHLYFVHRPISNEIIQYERGTDLLHDFQDGMWFDIVFLDIYMNDNDELVAASNVTGEVLEIVEF